MYFRLQQKARLLTVDENFAHLAAISENGDLEFEFTYTISQREVVKYNASKVAIRVQTRHISPKTIMGQTYRGQVDVKSIVDNVRTSVIDAKSAIIAQGRYLVASTQSDITAYINNEVIPQLRARTETRDIPHFNRPRLKLVPASSLKENNDPQPVMHRVANSKAIPDFQQLLTASAGENPQKLMHDMITRQGLDPSYIMELAPRVASEHHTHGGLSNPTQANELTTDPASRLVNHHLFPSIFAVPPTSTHDIVDSEMVHVLQTVSSDEVDVKAYVSLPPGKMNLEGSAVTQLIVTFDLIDSNTGMPVDSITKTLDVSNHLNIFHTPKLAPRVRAASSDISTRINLEIKQLDKGAEEVLVFKKNFWIASTEIEDYSLIGTYALKSQDQSLLVQVDLPKGSPVLYRIVPRGKQSTLGFEYTNVAVRPLRYAPVRSVALTAHQVDVGIQVEVRHIPTNVVAVQYIRWNLSTHEAEPKSIGSEIGFVDESTRQSDLLTTIDSDVQQHNVYRYAVRLIYVDGQTSEYGDATIEFIKPSPGEVDTRVDGLQVDHDNAPNVTFDITTSVVDTDMDAIKRMMENQGHTAHFQGDITAQRDELKKLIAHIVHRVDLNTGVRENFGILTDPSFDDGALRKNQAIKELEYGHRYRYEIYPLLRASETLFDGFQKEAVDSVTKKPYVYSPSKFLHPFTLRRGVIVSNAGAKQRYAKDPMAYGIIGSIVYVEVSFDQDSVKVVDPVASKFDRYLNVVTWRVQGDIHQVDHFLIMKQVHGMRTMLGKAHSEFPNATCQYIHPVSRHDVGAIQYIVVPVMNDYRIGQASVTNTLVIEAT